MQRVSRNAPFLLLAGALSASAALTLALTWRFTFLQDTWEYLIDRRAISADTVLRPHNEHIVAIPVLIEQLLLRLFGMTSARPEYVVMTLLLVAGAALFYVYMKRRVGPWPALFATVVILFLGPAWETLLWPFELCFVGSVVFGLAMLLALERGDRRGDIVACACLVASVAFSSLGLAFVAAAVVAVLQGPREERLARAYVFLVPVVLYALWYVGWGHEAESHLTLRNVMSSPRFVADALATSVGSVVGLGPSPYGGTLDPVWGRVLLVALAIGLAYRQWRRPGFFAGLWPAVAAIAVYWLLAAFVVIPGREATASRYQYAGAIFLFMVLANLLQGVRPSRRILVLGAVVTVAALGPNLVILKDGRNGLQAVSDITRADLAAVEIARRTEDPDAQLNPEIAGTTTLVDVVARPYLEAVDEYGSPAFSTAELAGAPEPARHQADVVLASLLPLSSDTRPGLARPLAARGAGCVRLRSPADSGELALTPGLTRVELSPGPEATLMLRRFAVGEYPVSHGGVPGGSTTLLRIPRDGAPRPWRLHVDAEQPATVCR